MHISVGDFPSDIHGETYNLRSELTRCLQRSCTSESGLKLLKDILKFSISKLKVAEEALAEHIKIRDAKPEGVAPEDTEE